VLAPEFVTVSFHFRCFMANLGWICAPHRPPSPVVRRGKSISELHLTFKHFRQSTTKTQSARLPLHATSLLSSGVPIAVAPHPRH
jgi:hypothetical protein